MSFYNQWILEIRKKSRIEKLNQIVKFLKPMPQDKLLEVGIADHEYSDVDNFLIKQYPYPHNLAALSLGPAPFFAEKYPHVRLVTYGGGGVSFGN